MSAINLANRPHRHDVHRVVVLFPDSLWAFDLPREATIEDLALSLAHLGERHDGSPITVAVHRAATRVRARRRRSSITNKEHAMTRAMTRAESDFARQLGEKMGDLRRYARRLTGNAVDAEDLVQDCLLRALTNWHRFEPGTNLRAWLFTVMRNLHINSFRRPQKELPLPPDELALVSPERPANQEAAVELSDFLRAFDRLSPARQKTVLMVGWDGMSYDEVALRLDVPTGTVRSRLSRARQELRAALIG
jgi:RNA polymerase sigma-70 factor, ECF subfamily